MACAAPCARKGTIGCAASPTSAMQPSENELIGARLYSGQARQFVAAAMRLRVDVDQRAKARSSADRPATKRVMNQMRLRAEAQAHFRSNPTGIDIFRTDGRAKRDAAGERRAIRFSETQTFTHARTQSIRADQQIRGVLHRGRAPLQAEGDALAVGRYPGDGRSKFEPNIRAELDDLGEHALEVGAMHCEIRRSPALHRIVELDAHEDGVVRTPHSANGVRSVRDAAHSFEEPEKGQHARSVRRQLQSGAELLEIAGPLINRDAKAALRQSACRCKAADAGAGDDRTSGHTLRRVAQLALGRQADASDRVVIDVTGRTVRTDRLGVRPHVNEYVRMVEWRFGAGAHELLDPDFDGWDAWIVMEVRDGMIRHRDESSSGTVALKHVRRSAASGRETFDPELSPGPARRRAGTGAWLRPGSRPLRPRGGGAPKTAPCSLSGKHRYNRGLGRLRYGRFERPGRWSDQSRPSPAPNRTTETPRRGRRQRPPVAPSRGAISSGYSRLHRVPATRCLAGPLS